MSLKPVSELEQYEVEKEIKFIENDIFPTLESMRKMGEKRLSELKARLAQDNDSNPQK